jgi:hypothetical protein
MEVYQLMMDKLDKIKNNIEKIDKYSENNNTKKEYLESLNKFSIELNILESLSDDMYEEYILQSKPILLNNEDKLKQRNLEINKKIQDIFMPYMLYLNIMLQNK